MRWKIVSSVLSVALIAVASLAQSKTAGDLPIEEIIRRFAEAETQNQIARNNYLFTQDFDIMTIGEGGSITGRFRRVSEIVFDDRGNRYERITHFPPSTLRELTITKEDMQDLAGVQPFALTTESLPKYNVTYVGREKLDELNTYVFDVKPKKFEKGERYFEGRIWVDDEDLQIVKAAGQGVPETPQHQYPKFETYRENIDGKFWFPTYTYADDVLEFKSGDVRIRMIVRYTNYKRFSTSVRIGEGGEVDDPEEQPEEPAKPKSEPPKSEKPELKVKPKPEKPPVN